MRFPPIFLIISTSSPQFGQLDHDSQKEPKILTQVLRNMLYWGIEIQVFLFLRSTKPICGFCDAPQPPFLAHLGYCQVSSSFYSLLHPYNQRVSSSSRGNSGKPDVIYCDFTMLQIPSRTTLLRLIPYAKTLENSRNKNGFMRDLGRQTCDSLVEFL